MEAFLFFAFIAFLIFPALMKGQKSQGAKARSNKTNSHVTINPKTQAPNTQPNKAQYQTLASRLQQKQNFETFKIPLSKVKAPKLTQVIKAVKIRGEILDLNKSRRNDWGQRHSGDMINGTSVLVIAGALLILLYIASKLT